MIADPLILSRWANKKGSSEESVGWNLIFPRLEIQQITVYFNENAVFQ